MTLKETLNKLDDYFVMRLDQFGATPRGVDYNGPEAQNTRFDQLVKVIDPSQPFVLLDYGCGYGALIDYLQDRDWQYEYWGVDVVEKMVIAGQETHAGRPGIHFTVDEKAVPPADYLLAGGIFNLKMDLSNEEWCDYSIQILQRMNTLCLKGFSFNLLTKYSDAEYINKRPDLYYGDPLFYFDYCKRHFSRNVALLHDYGLYDFTILVRKDF